MESRHYGAAVLVLGIFVIGIIAGWQTWRLSESRDQVNSLESNISSLEEANSNLEEALEISKETINTTEETLEIVRERAERLENQPIVFATIEQWGPDHSQEKTFDVATYNFGETEASDITVFCGSGPTGEPGNYSYGFVGDVGSVASNSANTERFHYTPDSFIDGSASAMCMAVSCEDCRLLGPNNENFEHLYDYYQSEYLETSPADTA